jgi:hypothetical protein
MIFHMIWKMPYDIPADVDPLFFLKWRKSIPEHTDPLNEGSIIPEHVDPLLKQFYDRFWFTIGFNDH